MGVPGLYSFLRRRYPQICRPTEKRREGMPRSDKDSTDNLYIDMNHIIHSCTHAHVAKDRPDGLSRAEQFGGMAAYLESLLGLLEPRRVVLVAVDGVALRAKMNQQRTRRFLSAHISDVTDRIEREVKREMLSEAGGGIAIPDVQRFDSNIITPGTDFMNELAQWLRDWAADKAASDPRFKHTAFIISDASEPGEGEHKVMKLVRHLRGQPGYDPNTRHVVYGQDADLLLLTLLCHEPHFRVMREDMQSGEAAGGKAAKEAQLAQEQQQLLQQRPLSAVAAALQEQQQQLGDAALPQLSLCRPHSSTGDTAIVPCSDHLHMPRFETVDIAVLRECLQWEFSELVGPPGPPGMYGSEEDDEESVEDVTSDVEQSEDVESASPPKAAAAAREEAAGEAAASGQVAGAAVDAAASHEHADESHADTARDAAATAEKDSRQEAGSQQHLQAHEQPGSGTATAVAAAGVMTAAGTLSPKEPVALPDAADDNELQLEEAGDESSDDLGDLLGLAGCSNTSSSKSSSKTKQLITPGLATAAAAGLGLHVKGLLQASTAHPVLREAVAVQPHLAALLMWLQLTLARQWPTLPMRISGQLHLLPRHPLWQSTAAAAAAGMARAAARTLLAL
ncbi:XRN 5'-3' exonuclease N-terminus-domain-containing protein [Scenedesmus sp. NREL 46B-D3]|nr:XRN 5'-3' exonuclease N-terminus-domain-containing protein [Scenedesmus sp. NREL 46B-D3]